MIGLQYKYKLKLERNNSSVPCTEILSRAEDLQPDNVNPHESETQRIFMTVGVPLGSDIKPRDTVNEITYANDERYIANQGYITIETLVQFPSYILVTMLQKGYKSA